MLYTPVGVTWHKLAPERRLGVAAALSVFIAAQLLASAVAHHFGLLGAAVRALSASRVFGIVLLLVGVYLVLRK